MKRFLALMKKNIKYVAIYVIFLAVLLVEFPYYIDAPGGLINVSERVHVKEKHVSAGTFNLAYVTEYKATLPMLFISLFRSDWTVQKKNTADEKDAYDEAVIRDRLWIRESYANAIILAYQKAGKEIEITNEDIYVIYIAKEANTNLEVGDKILSIEGIDIDTYEELSYIVDSKDFGDKLEIKVENGKKTYNREAIIINVNDKKRIGILPAVIREFTTNPPIELSIGASESGPSGGLMISLAVYDALTEIDITGGLTIVGTGTIDLNGNVGEIGGIDYKIKGAVRKKADIFFVPAGSNYEEAKKLVEKNKYKITLVPVSTFDEALEYLMKNVVK